MAGFRVPQQARIAHATPTWQTDEYLNTRIGISIVFVYPPIIKHGNGKKSIIGELSNSMLAYWRGLLIGG